LITLYPPVEDKVYCVIITPHTTGLLTNKGMHADLK